MPVPERVNEEIGRAPLQPEPSSCSIQEARSRLGHLVAQVRHAGQPALLTDHGDTVAVLISVEDFEDLAGFRALQASREHETAGCRFGPGTPEGGDPNIDCGCLTDDEHAASDAARMFPR